jgi:hypothetical protein
MTPVEIFEYKQKWMASEYNHPVPFHSDYRSHAKDWCKVQLHKSQWNHYQYSDVYEDTMYFEFKQDSENFSLFLKKLQKNG